ncbi:MAG: YdcF family protein [Caldilineaceae bacterium]|nr:YdcF family protein [Caldilineaceae bacterium]MBP8109022.1 YdcF family protein [Caldilineaceae bacterium]MBP8124627.1 YdcF family protein [Caldilineaceae bacterium]MBP9074004.1 YdcF family protein [Caldilineaceae bacterium]
MAQSRSPRPRKSRRWLVVLLILAGLVGSFPFLLQCAVAWAYADQMVTVEEAVAAPTGDQAEGRVAIIYGARVYASGRLSPMLQDRVETGVQLFHVGKVDTLLMSGDNRAENYDEPGHMRDYAISRGVPAGAILMDPSGLRTYDTCYRAKALFGVESALLVTQAFHLPRALFTCDALGLDVTGVVADQRTYSAASISWSESREIPALMVALFDVVRRRPATVMG